MTSVERIKEYTEINPEVTNKNVQKSTNWPNNGEISFKDVSFRHHENLPYVLHNISCHIKAGEKVSIRLCNK